MNNETKLVCKRITAGIILFLVFSAISFGVNSCHKVANTAVERKVFENSYQKSEADKDAHSTYAAELRMLRNRLNNPNLDESSRVEIQAQIDSITVLQSTKED